MIRFSQKSTPLSVVRQPSLTIKCIVLGRTSGLDSDFWLYPCVRALMRTLRERTGVLAAARMFVLAHMCCHSAWSMTGEACVVRCHVPIFTIFDQIERLSMRSHVCLVVGNTHMCSGSDRSVIIDPFHVHVTTIAIILDLRRVGCGVCSDKGATISKKVGGGPRHYLGNPFCTNEKLSGFELGA